MGPSSKWATYVKWAIQNAMSLGLPARQLSAEAIVGDYFVDSELPSGPDATDGHLWIPIKVLQRIFDDLSIPENQRTYAISFYEHRKCLSPQGIPCTEVGLHLWAEETLRQIFNIIGRKGSRVIAVEMGLLPDPTVTNTSALTAQVFESLFLLMKRYGVSGGSFWQWVFIQNNEIADPTLPTPVKIRNLSFSYNPVKDKIAQYFLRNPDMIDATSPNGGETWVGGTQHNITWTTTGTVANVKLEYSTNNGATWTTIAASTANTNCYTWSVPEAVSTDCLVQVSDTVTGTPSDTSDLVFTIVQSGTPAIRLSRGYSNFGTERNGQPTPAEELLLTNAGTGTILWTATCSADWISVSPTSGIGSGVLMINISRTDMSPGHYAGTIAITDPNASNSPQTINVGLDIIPVGNDSPPFGNYATPADGETVASSIPVMGWVLDDVGVQSVKIYRGTGLSDRVYIGDAVFSKGARPDVEAAYPGYPQNDRAGWGYMLLTNFLPNGGNGPFTLLAYATDTAGHEVLLGSKAITCDNLHAVKPFGAIDTPGQGGTASGSAFINFGWALTPTPNSIPTNGSTITVWVNGLPLGHPTYNNYRSDIATLFPGYANSNGAVGYYYLNTTSYANGVYTIAWSVADSGGNVDGIGSRYFTVQNVDGGSGMSSSEGLNSGETGTQDSLRASSARLNRAIKPALEIEGIPEDRQTPVYITRGFRDELPTETIFPGTDGSARIEIPAVSQVAVYLNEQEMRANDAEREARSRRILLGSNDSNGTSRFEAYELALGQLRPLPIGASFDSRDGVFYWQPGPGFLGEYQFVIIDFGKSTKKTIKVAIVPARDSMK